MWGGGYFVGELAVLVVEDFEGVLVGTGELGEGERADAQADGDVLAGGRGEGRGEGGGELGGLGGEQGGRVFGGGGGFGRFGGFHGGRGIKVL